MILNRAFIWIINIFHFCISKIKKLTQTCYQIVLERFQLQRLFYPDLQTDREKMDAFNLDSCKDFSFATLTYGKYTSRVLTNENHIRQAQCLLYEYYIKESKWCWKDNNPTGFQLCYDNDNSPYITDNYENNCLWIGSFVSEELVSIMRVVYRTDYNHLDMEGYQASFDNIYTQQILLQSNIIELQRFVTKREYRNQKLNYLCMLTLGKILKKFNLNVIATSSKLYFLKFGYGQVVDTTFDYGDGKLVNVMYFTQEDINSVVKYIVNTMSKENMNNQ